MSDGVVEATHELVRPGQRVAFVPSALPGAFEDNEPADWSPADYEQVRNAASGIAHAFDTHTVAARTVEADDQWREYAPPYRNKKIADARAVVAKETLKTVTRCEAIAANAEKEAAELEAGLNAPTKLDPAQVATNVRAYEALSREARVEQVHSIAKLLPSDSGADARMREYGRQYLESLMATNPFAGLLDSVTREFVGTILMRTKNPAAYSRARHLRLASRAIRENAQRVRTLIS